MNFLFPAVFAANTLAMTALMIGFSLAGHPDIAADVGIVQGASLALFYALSANARSLILNQVMPVSARAVMAARLWLLLPIVGLTFWLSTALSNVDPYLAAILILRRCAEWLGEVHLSELERVGNRAIALNYLLAQSLLLMIALVWQLGDMPIPMLGLFLWAFLPLLFSARFIRDAVFSARSETRGVWVRMLPHFGSTAIIGITVYVFRLLLLLMLGKNAAGDLFAAFAMGGIAGSVFANALGPSIVLQEKVKKSKRLPKILRVVVLFSCIFGVGLVAISFLNLELDREDEILLGCNRLFYVGWGGNDFRAVDPASAAAKPRRRRFVCPGYNNEHYNNHVGATTIRFVRFENIGDALFAEFLTRTDFLLELPKR
jgi:hypothetical protein